VALLAALALCAAPAQGDIGGQIVAKCLEHQSLQSIAGYSQAAYSKALKELSATAEEYSDCAALIREAQTAAASPHGTSAAGAATAVAPIPATPAEQRALARAVSTRGGPVSLGEGLVVHPGVVHANIASALSTLPTPLLTVLALMLAGLLGLGGFLLRRRTRGGRAD